MDVHPNAGLAFHVKRENRHGRDAPLSGQEDHSTDNGSNKIRE
jgi:hypothetical protein